MKGPPAPHVDEVSLGAITVDGKKYDRDVIIYPDSVDNSWWRREGHSLFPADLRQVAAAQPDVIVVGCGQTGVLKVPQETRDWVTAQGIEFIDLPTKDACEEYNRLKDVRRVVGCMHLTC